MAGILHTISVVSARVSPMNTVLSIDGLGVNVEGKAVLRDFSLEVASGEIHAIMGPNGSGKSTLVNALAGNPRYEITSGSVRYLGEDMLAKPAHERARQGLFLAFQYPKEIAGVTLRNFLFAAYNAQMAARSPAEKKVSPIKFAAFLTEHMRAIGMDPALAERSLNRGFSGGEKKKAEVLQMRVLRPVLALLDETDSGLDVDALRIVAGAVEELRSPDFSAVIVTHYARLLEYVVPDRVHVMVRGSIVESGDASLAHTLEKEGYARFG